MENNLLINQEGIHSLAVTKKWTMFLSIVGFIMSGLMVVLGFFFMLFGSRLIPPQENGPEFPVFVFFIMYVACGIIYFFPSHYLYKFSATMKRAVETQSELSLNESLRYLRTFFTFSGVYTIVMFSIMFLVIIVGILAAVFMTVSSNNAIHS